MKKKLVLGIDFGDVIIRLQGPRDFSFYTKEYLQCRPVPGSFSSIKKLRKKFGEHVFVVSKCTKSQEKKISNWLEREKFFSLTGVRSSNLIFCRKRSDKARISKRLGITHFVDDKLEVLRHMKTVGHLYYFYGKHKVPSKALRKTDRVLPIRTWQAALKVIRV